MSLERFVRWYNLLPKFDRAQPTLKVDSQYLSPDDIRREAWAGTELGKRALEIWESVHLGTDEEMLVERIKNRVLRYPQDKPLFIVLGRSLTPSEIIEEIDARTDTGKRLIENERRYLIYTDKLKERV